MKGGLYLVRFPDPLGTLMSAGEIGRWGDGIFKNQKFFTASLGEEHGKWVIGAAGGTI